MSPGATGIYLDHNATTPLDERALRAMMPFLTRAQGNPSSRDHAFGWEAAEAVAEARRQVADLIAARPDEIVFTSGATESINFALKGIAQSRQTARAEIVTAATEHEAVLETCRQVEAWCGLRTVFVPVDRAGRADPGGLEAGVAAGRTVIVALMRANNETGTVCPLHVASGLAHRAGALIFVDATQAVGKIRFNVRAEGIDLAVFSAHKVYGPKGVGALFIRGGEPVIELEPQIVGGGQERGLRAGTLNVPGIVGFGEACRIAKEEMAEEAVRVAGMRDRLEREILAALPDVSVNGDVGNRLPNTSNLCFHGVDARTLIRDMHNIAVSTRSTCSSGRPGPSHVLKAMGLSDDDAYSSVRFSLGRFTTDEEIDHAIGKVIASVRKLRQLGAGGG